MNRRVVIMRGISGSGKSTYIKKHLPGAFVCSADDFFVGSDGTYNFVEEKLRDAHKTCFRKFLGALSDWRELIVVDNTNTQLFEFSGYIGLAQAYDYPVEVVQLDTPVEVASARNLHGVPATIVQAMANSFQSIPTYFGVSETIVKGV